ncbi:MAG: fimbrillin family protein [Bacteroidales bacterium]|nr:fimbrillin family protein [Bacteroidales bacterium]
MKKYFILAAAALIALSSCSKSPIVTEAQSVDPDEVFAETDLYPITFSSNVLATKAKVKGSGSIDTWADTMGLHIYGIKRDADNNLDLVEGIQINNVVASAPDGVESGEIEVWDPALSTELEKVPFYYDNSGCYDFFGFYIDDAFVEGQEDPELDTDEGTITLPVQINGTQDVMLAYADRVAAVEGTSINPNKLYSAYGVRKGIIPDLKFAHQLSRFIFKVRKGTVNGEAQPGAVYVNSLAVDSYSNGLLTIVGEDRGLAVADDDALVFLNLTNRGQALSQTLVEGLDAQTLGESVMVFPGRERYNIKVDLANDKTSQLNNMFFDIEGGAIAGKSYVITITVYDIEEIKINVSLTEWDTDTDPIDIGQDED